MKPYDLHNHTKLSKDGKISGKELIDLATSRGLKGIGICDHDKFPDESLYDYARSKGIKLALGTEFSCEKAHIIGYNLKKMKEKDKKFLEEKFATLRKSYIDASKKTILQLQKKGINVSYEDVQKYCGKEDVQKLFVMKYIAEELGLFTSWSEAKRELMNDGTYVGDSSGVDVPDPAKVVDIIHDSGGYAIWAHPFITPEKIREKYFESLVEHDIDAIETSYAYKENGYKGDETNEELEKLLRQRLKKMKIPVSGGSDSHYPIKTDSDLEPIKPGDFGITQKEFEAISFMFR